MFFWKKSCEFFFSHKIIFYEPHGCKLMFTSVNLKKNIKKISIANNCFEGQINETMSFLIIIKLRALSFIAQRHWPVISMPLLYLSPQSVYQLFCTEFSSRRSICKLDADLLRIVWLSNSQVCSKFLREWHRCKVWCINKI